MDNNIIILAHVHRNTIEKVKPYKVFWWFLLIKSICFKYQSDPIKWCIIYSYIIGDTKVNMRLKSMEEITNRCQNPIALIILMSLPSRPQSLATSSDTKCIKVFPQPSSSYTLPSTSRPPMTAGRWLPSTVSDDFIWYLGI